MVINGPRLDCADNFRTGWKMDGSVYARVCAKVEEPKWRRSCVFTAILIELILSSRHRGVYGFAALRARERSAAKKHFATLQSRVAKSIFPATCPFSFNLSASHVKLSKSVYNRFFFLSPHGSYICLGHQSDSRMFSVRDEFFPRVGWQTCSSAIL